MSGDSPSAAVSTRTVAVIDIGTSAVRMALADIASNGDVRFLEKLNQSVRLGQDVFARGRIRRSTIEECVRILESFQQVMREYRVAAEDIRAVASSAVQEATNREALIDRVAMATGIEVEVIDEAEATRLTYLSMLPLLRGSADQASLVLEVGGGRTELISLRGDNIGETRAVRLGSLRLRNLLEQQRTPLAQVREVLDVEMENHLHQLRDFLKGRGRRLILLGGEARFLAKVANPEWDRSALQPIPLRFWKEHCEKITAMSVEACVEEYHMTFAEAETLGPALHATLRLAEATGARTLHVSGHSMRDGLLQEMAQKEAWTESYVKQMLDSSLQLGRKFAIDELHGEEAAGLALQLFDVLATEHRLGPRHRVLLHIASLLHEIGTFISSASHHKHSMYILANAPIFGLGPRDSRIVANIARYHRRSPPKPTHPQYQSLRRSDRIIVQQLSAILRVADALSRSRGRRIRKILCERRDDTFFIRVPDVDNLHLENSALLIKGRMFEEVFGMTVILVKG
jgi:exopolyphosphatase/guanosine-5'-triphosphate,3'-diphosphate pyrophosphatase